MTKDHVVPVSKGGLNVATNIVLACQSCNVCKGDMPVENFRTKYGFMRFWGESLGVQISERMAAD